MVKPGCRMFAPADIAHAPPPVCVHKLSRRGPAGPLSGSQGLMAEGRVVLKAFGVSDTEGECPLRRVEGELDQAGYRCCMKAHGLMALIEEFERDYDRGGE